MALKMFINVRNSTIVKCIMMNSYSQGIKKDKYIGRYIRYKTKISILNDCNEEKQNIRDAH